MKKIKKDLLEKFMKEFISSTDLNEEQDKTMFKALCIIASELADNEED